MHVVWISPFWPWPPTTGAHLRTGGFIDGLIAHDAKVTLIGPVESAATAVPAGCTAVAGVHSGHFRNTRIRNLFSGRALDSCRPLPDVLGRIDWADVDVVVLTQPFLLPVLDSVPRQIPVVLDAHNVEAELATTKPAATDPLHKLLDRVEAERIRDAERASVERADLVICPSRRDATLLDPLAVVVASGSEPSVPDRQAPAMPPTVLMVGHLGFAPNVDAVEWLADEIEPALHVRMPTMRLTVAGRDPGKPIFQACSRNSRIQLIADPADVRPLYDRAHVAVVPLRTGSGTRLKVLEAARLRVPLVTTSKGVEGLPFRDGHELLIADTAAEFAASVERLVSDRDLAESLADAAAVMLDEHFRSDRIAEQLLGQLERLMQVSRQ